MLNYDKVKDHCHLTGEYRGAAHNECNLNYKISNFFPIFFHNFSAYDCHLFVKELSTIEGEITIIPISKEFYISISKKIFITPEKYFELRFLDSFRFMPSSLDNLAGYLNDNSLKTVSSFFPEKEEFKLVKRKGIFPYDYLNSIEKLNDKQLPLQEHFFNKLTNQFCSEENYIYAQQIWNVFKCNNLLDYLLLYLKIDVLLLCDIFENFRNICQQIYNLDPCQYYTTPGLSWDAMLKTTQIEIELLTDINMHNFIMKGIRGGLVQCVKRHSIANNKYLHDYDPNKKSNYIIYLDVNNLYGYAMSQYIPYKNFEWKEDIKSFNLMNIEPDAEIGYILEVDLEYSESLHDYHNDLPFCAENKRNENMKYTKLIADFTHKTNYIIHYRNLQQCLKHGIVLTKIHRILQFNQSDWLKKYIDYNNHFRTLATNDFEKNFFKLLNNAVYGKTMENVDKRKEIKLVCSWENKGKKLGARSLIAKFNFHSLLQFNEEMLAIQMQKENIFYNKPIYIGFTVLELSKYKMYSFHYDYMKPKYNTNISLMYMDTDSFIYDIETIDYYNDIKPDIINHFDTSEYAIDNIYNLPLLNKKTLGMMKDECKGNLIKEFIGLRAKMYSFKIISSENNIIKSKEIKKLKGVKKSVTSKLTINDFRNCLYRKQNQVHTMYLFKSKLHEIYTQEYMKVSLNYLDDKRFIKENNIHTLAWNHKDIQ